MSPPLQRHAQRILAAIFAVVVVVVGCGPSLPRDCGCIMSLPGSPQETCIAKAVSRVKSLTIVDFEIVESRYPGRTWTRFSGAGPVDLFDGEIVAANLEAGDIEQAPVTGRPDGATWVQPICYAARIDNGQLSNVVEGGAMVYVSSDWREWTHLPIAEVSTRAQMRCEGGGIANTSVARERAALDKGEPTRTACTGPKTAAELDEQARNFKVARSGEKLYFESGVHGTEAPTNPFTQARTPAVVFHCGACTPSCPAGSCGDDGCGGRCECDSGQTCNGSTCDAGPCVPRCAAGACGSDGCGGTCACGTGEACVSGRCTPCTCGAKSCGVNACGQQCHCKSATDVCQSGRCVPQEQDPCVAPARWCSCTESCLNPFFCRKREDEGGCVDARKLRVPVFF